MFSKWCEIFAKAMLLKALSFKGIGSVHSLILSIIPLNSAIKSLTCFSSSPAMVNDLPRYLYDLDLFVRFY